MTLAEQIKQAMEWDEQNKQTVFPDRAQLQLTEVIRQLIDIVTKQHEANESIVKSGSFDCLDKRIRDKVINSLALSAPIVKGV